MRVLIACLLAVLGPAWAQAEEYEAWSDFVEGPSLSFINSVGVAGVDPATKGGMVTLFDSFTGAASYNVTAFLHRTYMGDPFTVAAEDGFTVRIDEARFYLASLATQSFSNGMVIRVQFWDDFDGSDPVAMFSNPAGGVQTFTFPFEVNLDANTFYLIDLTFSPPIFLSGPTGGFVINYQGDNGGGPQSLDTLTSLIRGQHEPGPGTLAVGSLVASGNFAPPNWGFYLNINNQTNFNHPNTDHGGLATLDDTVLAVQLRGAVETLIFGNGFEEGDTSAWSQTLP